MHNDLDNNNVESWRELSELAVIEQEPTRARYLVYALIGVVSLVLLWSAWATVDTVSRGQGKVIPSRQVQVVGSQVALCKTSWCAKVTSSRRGNCC